MICQIEAGEVAVKVGQKGICSATLEVIAKSNLFNMRDYRKL